VPRVTPFSGCNPVNVTVLPQLMQRYCCGHRQPISLPAKRPKS
jgi:hypothetical protein